MQNHDVATPADGALPVDPSLNLPLDYSAIARILPHRYPFLLVDRIIEFEPDKRIVGIKNVSVNEPHLSTTSPDGRPSLPPTILTEVVAQVGAILILAKPEHRNLLIFFRGIERVRYRGPVYPGDVVTVEVRVKRLRNRMGVLEGRARVGDRIVINGTMTFALGSKDEGGSGS
jgi:3-hydroxyacyl-[acyl-carrier-protein] dehydratase